VTAPSTPDARFFPGWIVVGAAFLLLMANSGFIFYGQAVYLDALTDERGFSTGAASLGQSIVFVVGGLVGPRIGRLITERDVRLVVLGGLVTSWLAVALLGRVVELWQLYLVNVALGVGFSAAGLVPATTVITRWFEVRRSVALAIASTGLSVGGLTFTQLAGWWIDRDGLELATPWLVVVFAELWEQGPDGAKVKNYYVKESVGIACGLFVASLHVMGLATLTHTPSPMAFLNRILERPENEKPYVLFPVGYPAPGARVPDLRRKALDEVAIFREAPAGAQ